jgi:hypothetical protein
MNRVGSGGWTIDGEITAILSSDCTAWISRTERAHAPMLSSPLNTRCNGSGTQPMHDPSVVASAREPRVIGQTHWHRRTLLHRRWDNKQNNFFFLLFGGISFLKRWGAHFAVSSSIPPHCFRSSYVTEFITVLFCELFIIFFIYARGSRLGLCCLFATCLPPAHGVYSYMQEAHASVCDSFPQHTVSHANATIDSYDNQSQGYVKRQQTFAVANAAHWGETVTWVSSLCVVNVGFIQNGNNVCLHWRENQLTIFK